MIPVSTNALAAFQPPSSLPINSIGTSQFCPRADKWWPASESQKIPASDGALSMRRSRPTLSMALGFSAAVGGILPKQLMSGSVTPALQGLGELLPSVGAPMVAILCLTAASFLVSMLVSFVVKSFSLWWSMAVRSRRALPSSTFNSAVKIEKLKDEYQRMSAVKAQALTRIDELSKNLESLQGKVHDDAKYARANIAAVEERVQSVKSLSEKYLDRSARKPIPSFARANSIKPSQLGNTKSAEMERSSVATVAAPSLDTASLSGTIGDQWEVITETGSAGQYALLRHLHFKTSIELPLFGMGVLFAGGPDSVVRRCWADGTLYERFAFHTGTTLIDADAEGQPVSRKLLSDPDGVSLGSWLVHEGDEFITVKSSKHDEELVLLRDGFAFFGGGNRGVIVQGGSEPEVERTSLLRTKIGLPEAAESVRKPGRGEAARARSQDVVGQSAEDVPVELVCALSQAVMSDPWIASDGFSYERKAIEEWFARKGARSPTTGLPLPDTRLVPNNALRSIIATYVEE